ncbi:bifunctional diaminohydroxyphosphoribosylaminopyrimidine deaminase/5-amino-6-(5-phosphoribosylamino)uracil reductase RibD [Variovorax dokdonensis]|uniref:Riboflavin biosynthesis protein RibD n=1 Tax=Variovorax dokdonensis TaxID=344883 RepID=A0ABT7NCZ7_9BURK|nr:bifunctional diaminohydroxyphosphoribosylaminopyrimidine deaminase/5-amino-6-(5-phosphoribosylamino)uracil reductase RibD [Variovorax dokdonensis]MDM0045827.1 bifunctional diaminohydroxyphosphoribosylaminopyrimidine deaminase/5-amino-6-(5-phosphoribosylamino)uracil reductase RibD [Variovorax dokdonensis]
MMQLALEAARHALRLSPPNPAVGCVLVAPDGSVIGVGHTQRAGGPHAEIMALRDAQAHGRSVEGATAYVTLEPCAHHGRTGPCCDALAQARIAKVVASLTDPNPLVAGQGFARLRAAGVDVEVGPGADEARELNIGFLSRMVRGLPWVRMKAAATLDGRTALDNGASQWITGAAARADGHAWRARAGAILTGVGTVMEDDPRLDVREVETTRQPPLVLVDSRLQTPPDARLFDVPGREVWIYAAQEDAGRAGPLEDRGAQVKVLPNADGKVDLAELMRDLARREVNELHVEAGQKLNGSLLREGQVDELLLYVAPTLFGEGMGIASGIHGRGPMQSPSDALALQFRSVDPIGHDLRILARLPGRDGF